MSTDRNFATIAMLIALGLDLVALVLLIAVCGVRAEVPLVNTLATGAIGIGGAIAGLAVPKTDQK